MRVKDATDAAANGKEGGAGISDFGRFIMDLVPQITGQSDGERTPKED
jgi:hypothetical protein